MGDGEGIARAPAVKKPVRPDPRNSAPGHLADLQEGELLPLVDRDRVEPGVEGAGSRGGIEISDGFVEVVHDDRAPFEVGLDQVFAELQAQADGIPVVVMGDVLAPIDERDRFLILVFFFVEIDIHGLVPAVDLEDRGHKNNHVLADGLDVACFFDGQAISELHHHLGRATLLGVKAAGYPVDGKSLGDDLGGVLVLEPAGVGQASHNLLEALEAGHVLLGGDGDGDHFPALVGRADGENLDSR